MLQQILTLQRIYRTSVEPVLFFLTVHLFNWLVMSLLIFVGPVREYMLPYENEVGLHPSMNEMKEAVDTKRIRPPIEQHWLHHKVGYLHEAH